LGPADRLLGRLLCLTRRLDEAERYALRAVGAAEASASPPWSAWSRYDLAVVLARRGDQRSADALMARAARDATALGLQSLVDRVSSFKAPMGTG
jgi:hypothetical protein